MSSTNKSSPVADQPAVRNLRLEWVEAGSLSPNPRNWRRHPEAQMAALKGLIADEEVGWAGALLFNERTGRLIDGHARQKVVDANSIVPVLIGSWSEAAEKRILLTLDPIAGMAMADIAQLEALLAEVDLGDEWMAGLRDQLDEVIADSRKAQAEADAGIAIVEDEIPEPPKIAVAKSGDIWQLGEHRLLCGDSTSPDDVARLLDGQKAALVATDPPYLVDYTGDRPNGSGKDWTDVYHEVDIGDADTFFRLLFTNVVSVIAPHAAIYCWHAHRRQALISRIWSELGILDHQQIVWVKPTPVFGRSYWHFQHEPCMMGWVQGSAPEHNGDHSVSSVWTVDWEGKARIVGNEHPTQKPVELFARPMRKHTQPGDLCFEPFSGSGSQIMAAEQLGRRCYAIELEPVFVDVAVKRWENFTGSEAKRVSA